MLNVPQTYSCIGLNIEALRRIPDENSNYRSNYVAVAISLMATNISMRATYSIAEEPSVEYGQAVQCL